LTADAVTCVIMIPHLALRRPAKDTLALGVETGRRQSRLPEAFWRLRDGYASFRWLYPQNPKGKGKRIGDSMVISTMARSPEERLTLASTKSRSAAESRPQGEPLVVTISLVNYWHETIERREAIRRLRTRALEPKRQREIERDIPERTEHFLTFSDGAFREYAYSGRGNAALVLMLPVLRDGTSFAVFGPVSPGGERQNGPRYFCGMGISVFTMPRGRLFENGDLRPTFRFSKGPLTLPLDVSFTSPGRRQVRHNFSCCGACEWVHSALDVHWADPLCCLASCGGGHGPRARRLSFTLTK
jgi:hypothetical protein